MDLPTLPVREKRAVKKTSYADLDSEATSDSDALKMSDYEENFKPVPKKPVNSKPKSANSKTSKKTGRAKKPGTTKSVPSKPEPAATNPPRQSDEEDDPIVEKPVTKARQPNVLADSATSDEELSAVPPAKSKPLSRPKTAKVTTKKANAGAQKKQSQSQTKRSKTQTTLEESEEDIPPTKRIAVGKKKAPPSKPTKAKSKVRSI